MDKRKIIIIISGISIVLFAYFSMKWLGGMNKNPSPKPPKEVVRFVNTEKVKYQNYNTSVEYMGRVTSHSEIVLIAEVRGEIMRGDITFKVGESFKKGDMLVKIDDEIELNNMKSRKSSFLNSVALMLPDLKTSLPEKYDEWNFFLESIEIDEKLPDLPNISTAQERIYMASRNILTNYYTVKSAEANFESYHIYAPFDGTITEVNLQTGAVANPGTRLGMIINTVNLELEVPVNVDDAKWLKNGSTVQVFNSNKTSSWKGMVTRKAQSVSPNTQSINIYVELNSTQDNPVYKGEYLVVVFSGIKVSNVMEISRNAIFNQNVVFTVEDGILVQKIIEVNKINKDKLFFTGLSEGTDVVSEPLINASENSKVKILGRE